MKTELTKPVNKEIEPLSPDILQKLVIGGDMGDLNAAQQVQYYVAFCQRLGLDPATQPFRKLKIQGRTILYADHGCAQQLCNSRKISHKILSREIMDGIFIVTSQASTPDGRQTESIGAVPIEGLKGEARANALMRCETKSKRRSTLDLVGLGIPDAEEIDSIPGRILVDEGLALTQKAIAEIHDWRKVSIHFGKHKGAKLGDLTPEELAWWGNEWHPKPYNGTLDSTDLDLRAALDAAMKEEKVPMPEGVQTAPPEVPQEAPIETPASPSPDPFGGPHGSGESPGSVCKDAKAFAYLVQWLKDTGISDEHILECCAKLKIKAERLADLDNDALNLIATKRYQTRILATWNEKNKGGK